MQKTISKEVQNKIITYIKTNYPEIPERGFIAGQAVASLVYKFLELPLNIVINDVDIFIPCDIKTNKAIRNRVQSNSANNIVSNEYDHYSHTDYLDFKTGRGYQVIRSINLEENEKINIIKVRTYTEYSKNEEIINPMLMLNSFDMNCCSIGYDIQTGEFFWTHSFISFINDLTLRIQSSHTPFHSFIRLSKKIKDINCQCNLFQERRLLIQYIHLSSHKTNIITGSKFWSLFEKNKEEMNEFFEFGDYFTENNHIYKICNLKSSAKEKFNIDSTFHKAVIDKLDNKYLGITYYNALFYVHLYHIINDTGLFTFKYRYTFIKLLEKSDDVLPIFYLNFCSKESLRENNDFNYEKITECFSFIKDKKFLLERFTNCVDFEDYRSMSTTIQNILKKSNKLVNYSFFNDLISFEQLEELENLKDKEQTKLINNIIELKANFNNNFKDSLNINLHFSRITSMNNFNNFYKVDKKHFNNKLINTLYRNLFIFKQSIMFFKIFNKKYFIIDEKVYIAEEQSSKNGIYYTLKLVEFENKTLQNIINHNKITHNFNFKQKEEKKSWLSFFKKKKNIKKEEEYACAINQYDDDDDDIPF